jgi:hypothetical protein
VRYPRRSAGPELGPLTSHTIRLPRFAAGYANSYAFRSYQRRHCRPVINAT